MTMLSTLRLSLRSIANAFLGRTGKPDRLDTRLAWRWLPISSAPEREPALDVDPLEELVRIVGEREPEPTRRARTRC